MQTGSTRFLEHKGCRLAYTVRGAGEPVLFIQGVGVHGCGWGPQIDAFENTHQCLAFDNRGIGESQPLGAELSIEQMADDAVALIDSQGWTAAHVVGHSMGGPIAMQVAFTAPERVKSLSLLCTFARGRDVTALTLGMMWRGLRTRVGTRRMRRRAFLEMVVPDDYRVNDRDVLAGTLACVFGHDLADQPPIVMKQLSAMSRFDATSLLGSLGRIPTLVVSAKHDRIARAELGCELAGAIPNARYAEIDNAAHGVTIQRAHEINALLATHFENARLRSAELNVI